MTAFKSRPLSSIGGDVRRLLLLLPDQLHTDYLRRAELDPETDAVVQMELEEDFTHIPSHKQRTALVLSAMRHFAAEIERAGYQSAYLRLEDRHNDGDLGRQLERASKSLGARELVVFRPGSFRTLRAIEETADELGAELVLREDPHFLVEPSEFEGWAEGRKTLVMEHFYRWMRRRLGVLLTEDGKPVGGSWNYDSENRESLDGDAPELPHRYQGRPDDVTREVLELVERRFADAPGDLDGFGWPVERAQALRALRHFIDSVLPCFGPYQDAMRRGEPWVFHSLLSPALNLKLLDPRECVEKAQEAYHEGKAPLNSVEGFIRQIIGWREYMRGVYWREGPGYVERNHLRSQGRLPGFYWSGETELECARQALDQVLRHGYGHHIQRLMVTGNLALVSGVHPREISDWYLGMYVDAMEWVTEPNTMGMTMFADGGVVGSKPYAASGAYINRMSNYCGSCRYDPGERVGDKACPVTTLYWDFLARKRKVLEEVPRMGLALRNLDRLSEDELREIGSRADALRREWDIAKT